MNLDPDGTVPPAVESTPDHELAAVEAFAKNNASTLPPEFKGDPAKFIESWKNLRASYTKATQELATLKKGTPAEATPPAVTDIDVDALEAEWVANGGALKPETLAGVKTKLEAAGIKNADQMISLTIEGRKAQRAAETALAAKAVGGEQNLSALLTWASTNLNEAEKRAANDSLRGPMAEATLRGLWAKMQAGRPAEPTPTPGVVSHGGSSAVAFSSLAEQNKAIADPKYRSDPNYRASIEARLRVTAKQGFR